VKNNLILIAGAVFMFACNSNKTTTDSVEQADSVNESRADSSSASNNNQTLTTDEASASFLVDAADGGMAEVEMGKMAQDKATNNSVKSFAAMMVHDHSAANDQVKNLASQRNVKLPDSVSNAHKNKKEELMKKTGAAFDKAYMDAMVKGHQDVVNMFEKGANNSKDEQVKSFINNTLPTIRQHLDSAKSIRKRL